MFKFRIPKGSNAWCMLCGKGFPSVDALGEHNQANVDEHKRRSGKKDKPQDAKTEAVAGSTVHAIGCDCGFCKIGDTKAAEPVPSVATHSYSDLGGFEKL